VCHAEGDTPTEYTLRRSCAQALDCLAVGLGDDLLPHVMPVIESYLQTKEWQLREAAVLALGAIADGCMAGLRRIAPNIITLLLEKTRDPQPNVRCNACWAVGRFAMFVVQDVAEMNGAPSNAGHTMLQVMSALSERAFVRSHPSITQLHCQKMGNMGQSDGFICNRGRTAGSVAYY
jgi:hypothetical protein